MALLQFGQNEKNGCVYIIPLLVNNFIHMEEIKEKETIKQVEEPQVNQEQTEEPKMETPFRDKFRGRYKDIED